MERKNYSISTPTKFHYSELKPVAKFALEHWSNPQVHEAWEGYEDLKVSKKWQLRAVRRQIFNTATFFMTRGETPTTIVPKLEEMLLPERRGKR